MRNTARRQRPAAEKRTYNMYMHTSAAPVFPQEDYQSERPVKRRRVKPDVDYDFIRVQEKRSKNAYHVMIPLITTALLSLCFLAVNAKISAVKAEIKETRALTQKTKAVNENLEMILTENIDLEQIRKTATTRLGMQTAAPHQVVKINVQKDSYAISYDDKVAEAKHKTVLEKLGIVNKE